MMNISMRVRHLFGCPVATLIGDPGDPYPVKGAEEGAIRLSIFPISLLLLIWEAVKASN